MIDAQHLSIPVSAAAQELTLDAGPMSLTAMGVRGSSASSTRASDRRSIRVVVSRRNPAGRRFAPTAEVELLPNLVDLAAALTKEPTAVAITEFVGLYGIADLVALVPTRDLLDRRLAADVAPIAYEPDAVVVGATAARTPRSLDEIANRLGWPAASVQRRLPSLLRAGAVARTSTGRLVRHPDLVAVGRLHAFEAKVKDWRRALDQARRYRLWADTASVALPRLPSGGADVRYEITRIGIGLGVDGEWLRRPEKVRHTQARRLLASELAVAALTAPAGPREVEPSPALPLGVEREPVC